MRILLDTHAALWAGEGDDRLGAEATRVLARCQPGEALIADVTLFEVSMLARRGRVQLTVPIGDYLRRLSRTFRTLPLSPAVADEATRIELASADLFDRLIVATAIIHDLTLVTRDQNIRDSGLVRVVW